MHEAKDFVQVNPAKEHSCANPIKLTMSQMTVGFFFFLHQTNHEVPKEALLFFGLGFTHPDTHAKPNTPTCSTLRGTAYNVNQLKKKSYCNALNESPWKLRTLTLFLLFVY